MYGRIDDGFFFYGQSSVDICCGCVAVNAVLQVEMARQQRQQQLLQEAREQLAGTAARIPLNLGKEFYYSYLPNKSRTSFSIYTYMYVYSEKEYTHISWPAGSPISSEPLCRMYIYIYMLRFGGQSIRLLLLLLSVCTYTTYRLRSVYYGRVYILWLVYLSLSLLWYMHLWLLLYLYTSLYIYIYTEREVLGGILSISLSLYFDMCIYGFPYTSIH